MSTTAVDVLRWRPDPGVWSAIEYVAHTGETIDWYHDRIHRALIEDRPRFVAFDWDTACDERQYDERAVSDVTRDVAQSCARLAGRLTRLRPADWEREGIGSDGSARSVETLARRAAHEAVHHSDDIRSVVARWTPGR